jgi:hypothetical protein
LRTRVVLVSVALAATSCGGADGSALLPPGRALTAAASVSPAVHLFGDPVVARLQVIVDRRQLDLGRLHARATFDPYEQVGDVRVSRRDYGRYTRVTYEFDLRCVEVECVRPPASSGAEPPTGGRRTFRFEPARILYTEPPDETPGLLRFAHWPPLESLSRINTAQLEGSQFPFRASTSPLPAVTHRVPPPLLAAVLLLGSFVLLVPGGIAAGRWWRGRRPPAVEHVEAAPTPLERALMRVDAAHSEADRRKALEELAAELERTGFEELGATASEHAWSRTPPGAEAAAAIVQRVRSEVGSTA